MKKEDIRSVAPLNAADGTINLGACFHKGSMHATFVNVSRAACSECAGDKDKLKQLWIDTNKKSGSFKLYNW